MPSTELCAADNNEIYQLGEISATITCGSLSVDDITHVVQGTEGLYLSWITAQKLTFIPQDYPVQQGRPLSDHVIASIDTPDQPKWHTTTSSPEHVGEELLQVELPSVFDGTICVMPGEEFKIAMRDSPTPFCMKTLRAVAYAYRDKFKPCLDHMVQEDMIELVTEPTEWCAPIVVMPKQGADDIRICMDLCKLNSCIVHERYHHPCHTALLLIWNVQISDILLR